MTFLFGNWVTFSPGNNRVGFGKDLKNNSVPDKSFHHGTRVLRIVQNLSKYGLLEGYRVYLDKLHKDHLEVFNKVGDTLLKVLNLDGSENAQKFFAATRNQCRRLS